jgi:hypothetical protein
MMLYTADWMYCCYGGTCGITGEYVETIAQMETNPALTTTPTGASAAIIQAQGITNYCSNTLRGTICPQNYICTGTETEFYYNTFCCLGTCTPSPINLTHLTAAYIATENDTSLPLTEAQQEELFNISGQELEANITDEEEIEEKYLDLEEDEVYYESLADIEEPPSAVEETLEQVSEAADQALQKVNLIHVIGIILAIIVLVLLLVALFRRKATKEVSAAQAPPADLQKEIDDIVSQGIDYKEAEQLLLQKGHDKMLVDSEIRKNYQNRLELQKRGMNK